MAWRQSNNQWSCGIGAHPAPKRIPSAEFRWKSSRLDFLGSRRHPHWLSCKGPNFQRRVLLISAGSIYGSFEGKTLPESHEGRASSCTIMPRFTGHLQPRRNWATWASSVLITHPILQIRPRRTIICSLDGKIQLKIPHFCKTRRSLLPRRPGWTDNLLKFFLSGLQKSEQRTKISIVLRGKFVE